MSKIQLQKAHFYLLGCILLNSVIKLVTGYQLNQNLIFALKVILYFTGIVLFFTAFKPIKKIAIYYSFYTISALIAGLLLLFKSFLLFVLASIVLMPIYPKQKVYQSENICIYNAQEGFMIPCCSYQVVEPMFYIFEKHVGYLNIDRPIDSKVDKIILKNNSIIYTYQLENDGNLLLRDTTEIITLKQ